MDSDILSLLLGPDGMRQSVVTGRHFPEEKFSAGEIFLTANPLTYSTMDLVNSSRSRDCLCLSFSLLDSTLLGGSVERYLEFEVVSIEWAHGFFNP